MAWTFKYASCPQAFQLRDNINRVNCDLRWVASGYDLADAFTKKGADSRVGWLKFLQAVAYGPNFVAAKRDKKSGKMRFKMSKMHLAIPLTARLVPLITLPSMLSQSVLINFTNKNSSLGLLASLGISFSLTSQIYTADHDLSCVCTGAAMSKPSGVR
jgi:hypothetical protein